MNDRVLFLSRWKSELPAFVRVLKALPDARLDYSPHARSRPAGRIAAGIAEDARALAEIIEKGEAHWQGGMNPRSTDELVEVFERNAARLTEILEGVDDAKWESHGRLLASGQIVFAGPIREHCWWILFDGVHHRGQLSAYIRPMGGKVPSIYGPSGDDPA
jgi:uncharacterized damage-inducible protein DinB